MEIHPCQFTAFCIEYCHNKPFFVTCNDILRKIDISLPWKKTCRNGYAIFLFLLTKIMMRSNAQLAHFSYLFRMATDCGLMYKSSANSHVHLCGFHSTNPRKAFWSSFNERLSLGSSLNNILSKRNSKTSFRFSGQLWYIGHKHYKFS